MLSGEKDLDGVLKAQYMTKDQKDLEINELPTVVKSKMIAHSGACTSLAFNVHGDQLATAGADRQVKIWGIKKKNISETMALKNRQHAISCVAFSLDNQYLVSCSTDNKATLYYLKGQPTSNAFAAHSDLITSTKVSFSLK